MRNAQAPGQGLRAGTRLATRPKGNTSFPLRNRKQKWRTLQGCRCALRTLPTHKQLPLLVSKARQSARAPIGCIKFLG